MTARPRLIDIAAAVRDAERASAEGSSTATSASPVRRPGPPARRVGRRTKSGSADDGGRRTSAAASEEQQQQQQQQQSPDRRQSDGAEHRRVDDVGDTTVASDAGSPVARLPTRRDATGNLDNDASPHKRGGGDGLWTTAVPDSFGRAQDSTMFLMVAARELRCTICLDTYDSPTMVSGCGHTFCRPCVEQAIDATPSGEQARCPLCKGRADRRSLVPVPQLARLVDIATRLGAALDVGEVADMTQSAVLAAMRRTPTVASSSTMMVEATTTSSHREDAADVDHRDGGHGGVVDETPSVVVVQADDETPLLLAAGSINAPRAAQRSDGGAQPQQQQQAARPMLYELSADSAPVAATAAPAEPASAAAGAKARSAPRGDVAVDDDDEVDLFIGSSSLVPGGGGSGSARRRGEFSVGRRSSTLLLAGGGGLGFGGSGRGDRDRVPPAAAVPAAEDSAATQVLASTPHRRRIESTRLPGASSAAALLPQPQQQPGAAGAASSTGAALAAAASAVVAGDDAAAAQPTTGRIRAAATTIRRPRLDAAATQHINGPPSAIPPARLLFNDDGDGSQSSTGETWCSSTNAEAAGGAADRDGGGDDRKPQKRADGGEEEEEEGTTLLVGAASPHLLEADRLARRQQLLHAQLSASRREPAAAHVAAPTGGGGGGRPPLFASGSLVDPFSSTATGLAAATTDNRPQQPHAATKAIAAGYSRDRSGSAALTQVLGRTSTSMTAGGPTTATLGGASIVRLRTDPVTAATQNLAAAPRNPVAHSDGPAVAAGAAASPHARPAVVASAEHHPAARDTTATANLFFSDDTPAVLPLAQQTPGTPSAAGFGTRGASAGALLLGGGTAAASSDVATTVPVSPLSSFTTTMGGPSNVAAPAGGESDDARLLRNPLDVVDDADSDPTVDITQHTTPSQRHMVAAALGGSELAKAASTSSARRGRSNSPTEQQQQHLEGGSDHLVTVTTVTSTTNLKRHRFERIAFTPQHTGSVPPHMLSSSDDDEVSSSTSSSSQPAPARPAPAADDGAAQHSGEKDVSLSPMRRSGSSTPEADEGSRPPPSSGVDMAELRAKLQAAVTRFEARGTCALCGLDIDDRELVRTFLTLLLRGDETADYEALRRVDEPRLRELLGPVCGPFERPSRSTRAGGAAAASTAVTAHYNCLHWSPEVAVHEDGTIDAAHKAVARGKRIRCAFCNRVGATLGCFNRRCRRSFHLPCALLSGHGVCSLVPVTADDTHAEDSIELPGRTGQWRLYCSKHAPSSSSRSAQQRE